MITWYSVTSEEFNAAPASLKSKNKLFFLTDTLELYKGDKLYSKSVDFYENTIPTNPAINRLYIEKNTHEGRVWTGSEWIVVIQPIQLEVDVLNTTKPVSGFAVFNYLDQNYVKYSENQELDENKKLQARKNINAVSADEIPDYQVQTDWNQSDDTAPDFIKNRTHYKEDIYRELFAEQEIIVAVNNLRLSIEGLGTSFTGFESGSVYNVTLDGVTYECIGSEYTSNGEDINNITFIGDIRILDQNLNNSSNEPFVPFVITCNGSAVRLGLAAKGNIHTLSVTTSVNDEIVQIIPESEFDVSNYIKRYRFSDPLYLNLENEYIIEFEGVEYSCKSYTKDSFIAIGNASLFPVNNGESVSNEPFLIIEADGGINDLFLSDFGRYTLKIGKNETIIHHINDEYISENIARVKDIDNALNAARNIILLNDISNGKKYELYINDGTLITTLIGSDQDFTYIDNGDGTRTIIEWNGTLYGEPSTELVTPPNVIL